MIVLDASALLDLLLGTDRAEEIFGLIGDPGNGLCAPDHLMVETARVLRRHALAGYLGDEAAGARLGDALDLDIVVFPSADLIPRAWQLRNRCSLDDALYVALAESVEGPLVTTDQRLARGVADLISTLPATPDPP